MNRLVINGNGFDLAHGLPTGYCDFIDKYWNQVFLNLNDQDLILNANYKDEFISFQVTLQNASIQVVEKFNEIKNYKEYKDYRQIVDNQYRNYNGRYLIAFKNKFFKNICEKHYIQKWVDIENEYYKLLKDCLKETDNSKVKRLNQEFNDVKNLLENYLFDEVLSQYNFSKPNKHLNKIKDIFNVWTRLTERDNFLQEFSNEDQGEAEYYSNMLSHYNNSGQNDIRKYISNRMRVDNLFLSFNYTQTLDVYLSNLINDDYNYYGENTLIQIHGRIRDIHNKINFGFGDEMDNHYKLIEEKDDNEYLKNIKSFQYLQNSNYKRFLDFVESNKFQVYIMGHSCGLSDRILLNTIFEHQNCRSIKVFYHETEVSNNYTEIVQNISRHFNKKKMMREKIVNKSLCQPLPQNVRFEKINSPQS